mmetsp:Transcript_24997/g.58224  ORF Transcript_24997/g.58224 Transcript_24997/m.58224 type:complete len:103 (-) Transcript_24997:998-1306(-)
MNGDLVKSMLESTAESFESQLSNIVSQMSLYLDNPATQSILLKPVSRKIQRSLEDARKFVQQTKDGENGWDTGVRDSVMKLLGSLETSTKNATKASSSASHK